MGTLLQDLGMVTRTGLDWPPSGWRWVSPLSYLIYRGVVSAVNLFEGGLSLTYALWVTLALAGVAALSAYLPARSASRVAPVAALKD
jgi:ABC-type antimicrobial peptide transport system permease subunit